MTDVAGKLEQDFSQGKRAHPASRFRSDEYEWRSSRRSCSGPNIHEPDKISGRPPFVPRIGSHVQSFAAQSLPPMYNKQVDKFKMGTEEKERRRQLQRARKEVRDAKTMVVGLNDWESELPWRTTQTKSASPIASFIENSKSDSSPLITRYSDQVGPPRTLRSSASDSRLEARFGR